MAPNTPTIKLPDVLTKGKTSRHTRKTTHPWRERTMKVYDKICSYRTTGPNAKTKRASSANARDGKVNVELPRKEEIPHHDSGHSKNQSRAVINLVPQRRLFDGRINPQKLIATRKTATTRSRTLRLWNYFAKVSSRKRYSMGYNNFRRLVRVL